MLYLLSVIAAVGVFFLLRGIGKSLVKSKDEENQQWGNVLRVASFVVLFVWIGLHTGCNSIYQIPAGHVGVLYEFGSIQGQITEGLQSIAPWRSVQIANIQVQSHSFKQLNAFSAETQDVFIDATLNIRVSPETIQDLYRRVGPNWFDVIVSPRVMQNFKDEAVKYKSVDIAPNREGIRKAVSKRLETECSPYSIEVVDLLLNNIDFPMGFKAAIEKKQIATQNALEEEQKVAVQRHMAEQMAARANGYADSIMAVAQKQADANKQINSSLTGELIRWQAIQKWNGVLPQVTGGAIPLLQLKDEK
ncbi:MAG: prohibitin family protein [Candidatus Komeilibacteria bacterium]|nr:prohibitin family protein [Candidatus Komeilibacteria bacterium]